MEPSIIISAFALLVSVFSAWVSYRTHRRTVDSSERTSRLRLSREKSEFLVRIEASRKRFERARQRISWLLTQIDGQEEAVRVSLNAVKAQLASDETYLHGCIRQASALWDETYEMSQEGLAHHKPHHLALIEDDDDFAAKALDRAGEAEMALNQAQFVARPIVG